MNLLGHVTIAISELRCAEVGGCFRPEHIEQGECGDGDCYCYRQCEREARKAMTAVAFGLEQQYGERHPGVIAIRNALDTP